MASGSASAVLDPEAQRLAAERRRERLAKEKAERDAKAKVLVEERERELAARQQQESAAAAAQRRRDEDAGLRRPQATPAPQPAPPQAQARTVREICAGRGTIAQAVCESRTCGDAQHANEAICRQIRENDERRRNYNN
jgi:SLT domain-containing protein